MTIKHIVISGGGPTGFLSYGVISYLEKKGFWNLTDIKSIYGCSIGAFIGFVISLGYDWEWIDDYIIKRPWNKLIDESKVKLIDIYDKKCIINDHFITESIIPLLKGKGLKEDINMLEFYEHTNIDLHMYTTNINTISLLKVDISHKTHPDLSLIKALKMTTSFPFVFEPIVDGNDCFIDGGLLNNFPLNDCIEQQECNNDEILALKNIWKNNNTIITDSSSILDYLFCLIKKTQNFIDTEKNQQKVKYTVYSLTDDLTSFDKWSQTSANEDMRRDIIQKGRDQANVFLSNIGYLS